MILLASTATHVSEVKVRFSALKRPPTSLNEHHVLFY